ncbi:MAG TPA: carboxypeptidase-like regulatory domain-containing protein [Thermoanaerobaculia bacterium]
MIAIWFAILSGFLAGEPEPIIGRLCIDGMPCVEHHCGQAIKTPSDERRTFALTSANTVYLGFIEAGRSTITCTADGTLELRLNVARGVKPRVTIGPWTFAIPWQQKPFLINVPRGDYAINIETPHYVTQRQTIQIGAERLSFSADLSPLPHLSGRIVTDKDQAPVAGALIGTDTTEPVTTDAAGRFVFEIDPEKWPTHVDVDAIGYAETSTYVPRPRVNTNLDDIHVVPGASITVEIKGTFDSPPEIALEKRLPGRVEGIAYRRMSAAGTFSGVAPGSYVVLLKGTGPCQHHGTLVDVGAGERKSISIAIERFRVHVLTSVAGERLPATSVVLRNHDFHWQGELETDSAGETIVELWQGGNLTAWLAQKDVMTVPYRIDRELANGKDTDWPIDIPGREIDGVVVDSQSGEPVAKAAVALRVQDVENGVGVHTRTDDTGYFRFMPAPYGRHTVMAASSDHMPGEISYTFLEPEQNRTVTLRLDPAVKVRLTVQDQRGHPLADAHVLQFRGGAMAGAGVTNSDGIIDVPAAKDELRDIYVVPQDGSFAALQIRDDQPQVVVVMDGTSRILLRTESPSGTPAKAAIEMSFNGRPVPREVLRAIALIRGITMQSGTDGRIVLDRMPPGSYELRAEGAGESSARRFAIGPGDNEARITVPQ